jgi:hypothetical protein
LKPIGIKWTASFGYLKHIGIKRTSISGYLNVFGIEELPVPGNRKNNRNKKTIGSDYFKNIKEPPGFMKELIIFWAVIWLFKKFRTRVIYQELGDVIFDNHGYISELDRVHFEITIDFYFYFSPVENFPFFDKEIGKILDFFSSVNSSKFC